MSKKTIFPAYDGRSFIEYLLASKQATRVEYDGKDLVITWSNEFERLNKKQKSAIITGRLQENK